MTPPAPPDAPAYAEYELNFDVGAGWRVTTPVPEPAALLVLGSGLVGLGAAAWRRSRVTS